MEHRPRSRYAIRRAHALRDDRPGDRPAGLPRADVLVELDHYPSACRTRALAGGDRDPARRAHDYRELAWLRLRGIRRRLLRPEGPFAAEVHEPANTDAGEISAGDVHP